MKNYEEQIHDFRLNALENKYRPRLKQDDPDWEFQKVQSVYQVAKEGLRHQYSHGQQQNFISKKYGYDFGNLPQRNQKYAINQGYNGYAYPQQSQRMFDRNIPMSNPLSKANSQTNIVSQNQSLQYLSSQQPSFYNKGQFTVFNDLNAEGISPVKMSSRPFSVKNKTNWQVASFAPKDRNSLISKCQKMFEFIQQLKFMKEGLESKLKQQKILFANEVQEIKKMLFKLNIKYEKQMLQFQKEKGFSSRQSSIKSSRVGGLGQDTEKAQLKEYCKKLQQEKIRNEQKYQQTLKRYQEEIEMISLELQRKISMEQSAKFCTSPSNCPNCENFEQKFNDDKNMQAYEIQIWKNRLQEQQQKHSQAMKKLEEKVLSLQQEFESMEIRKIEDERSMKQKQRQLVYRESQIEYKIKEIQKRQRDLQMAESMLQKQKDELERKKQKISDYQLKVFKQERRQKNQSKQKEILSSEYFNNCEKRKILSRNPPQQQRSDSVSSKGSSRIDINARLRQIQMMRGKRNYQDNTTSRNSSRDSRCSGSKDYYSSSRIATENKSLRDYGILPPSGSKKEFTKENSQTIKLSQKLNKLTETLQRELRQMS